MGGIGTDCGSPMSWSRERGTRSPAPTSASLFHCHWPVAGSTTLIRCCGVPWRRYPWAVSTPTTGSTPLMKNLVAVFGPWSVWTAMSRSCHLAPSTSPSEARRTSPRSVGTSVPPTRQPVGARTLACELRTPNCSPSSTALSQDSWAAVRSSWGTASSSISATLALCMRRTPNMAAEFSW